MGLALIGEALNLKQKERLDVVRSNVLRARERYPEVWEEILQISKKQPNEYTPEDESRIVELRKILDKGARLQPDSGRYFKVTYMDGTVIKGHTVKELCTKMGPDVLPSNVYPLIKRGQRVISGQFFGCWFERILYKQTILPDGTVDWLEETSLSAAELMYKERLVGDKSGRKQTIQKGAKTPKKGY